ncbi:bestrophin family protein [Pelomonas aquatica]|jgi:putative membrane protein|uniref:Bestrophin n=1 Tax=Pelomonas aquatica TaxID=431058 RepID=A0A9X4R3M6_9BURK|nr:bestrophin family ion channel [Pelomonas aquatica]MCY4753883.1 bestrophin family ion channel [Pelomonas aquatica]MDG0861209.1 bestrophin [Pelomonas aquatica]
MILRDRPSGLKLFFVLRGSILARIRGALLANVLLAVMVTAAHRSLDAHRALLVSTIPFTLMGLPLAIFLGFRNSACYDRYWEARKLWGELLLRSRNLARQMLHLVDAPAPPADPRDLGDLRVRVLLRAVAFCVTLKALLRDRPADEAGLDGLLQPAELSGLAAARNRPAALMMAMGADLARSRRDGQLDSQRAVQIDATLSALTAAAASCERIKNTPLPFSYSLLLHRTAYLYCFLLPFGVVDTLGPVTPLVVAIVAYTFFGLDALGDEIEEPFGTQANDLPLDALCRGIEIDLRQALGDAHPPPALEPVDYLLL